MRSSFFYFAAWSIVAFSNDVSLECWLPLPADHFSINVQESLPQPDIPVSLTEVTQSISGTTAIVSCLTAVGPTQIAQASRTGEALALFACSNDGNKDLGPYAWTDSPLQLHIGMDELQYNIGAVVGNWVIFAGASTICAGIAYRLGMADGHFPGTLILPTLLLILPTTSSSVTLVRDGNSAEKALGGISLIAISAGISGIMRMLLPNHFQARWASNENEWVNNKASNIDFVSQYGEWFESYGANRHWYVIVEILTSSSLGILKSYNILDQSCVTLVWVGAAIYDLYAASQLALRPNKNKRVQIFFSTIATIQALAVTVQAIASASSSKDTQTQVRSVTEPILIATDYLLLAKTLLDIVLRAKDWYERMITRKQLPQSAALSLAQLLASRSDSELDLPAHDTSSDGAVDVVAQSISHAVLEACKLPSPRKPPVMPIEEGVELTFMPTIQAAPENTDQDTLIQTISIPQREKDLGDVRENPITRYLREAKVKRFP